MCEHRVCLLSTHLTLPVIVLCLPLSQLTLTHGIQCIKWLILGIFHPIYHNQGCNYKTTQVLLKRFISMWRQLIRNGEVFDENGLVVPKQTLCSLAWPASNTPWLPSDSPYLFWMPPGTIFGWCGKSITHKNLTGVLSSYRSCRNDVSDPTMYLPSLFTLNHPRQWRWLWNLNVLMTRTPQLWSTIVYCTFDSYSMVDDIRC